MLYQLFYNSVARDSMDEAALQLLLACAREHNTAHGITGLLIYEDRTREFLQVIEGSEIAVKTLYDNICRDARHGHMDVLTEGPVAERGFGGWSMGFRLLGANRSADDDGFADIYECGFAAARLTQTPTRAKRLLQHVFTSLPGQAVAT